MVGEGRGVHFYRAAVESLLTFSMLLLYGNTTIREKILSERVVCALLTVTISIHETRMATTAEKLYTETNIFKKLPSKKKKRKKEKNSPLNYRRAPSFVFKAAEHTAYVAS